jgi:hypothetical protein
MSNSLLETIRRYGWSLVEIIKDSFDDSKIGEISVPCMVASAAKGIPLIPGALSGNPFDTYNLAMLAKAERSALYFSGQQSNKDTCALMSVNSVLYEDTLDRHPADSNTLRASLRPEMNLQDGTSKFEREMIALGEKSGGYTFCEGTRNESNVMTAAGIPAVEVYSPSLESIATAVEEGRGVVVGYDTRPVWHKRNPTAMGHTVRVTGVERDADGNVTALYINDSGDGTAPKRVPADNFKRALQGFDGGRMAVSKNPMFPALEKPTED